MNHESVDDYNRVLLQGAQGFGISAAKAMDAMVGTVVQALAQSPQQSTLRYDGVTVFCHFFGSVQGIFLLSLPLESAQGILGTEDSNEDHCQVDEFFKEVLNIASGETLEYMETHFGQLTYFPAVVTRGRTVFPQFASAHQDLSLPDGARMHCAIYLNLAEVKIGAELKRVRQSLSETEQAAHCDSLTQLFNRLFFDKSYTEIVQTALHGSPILSVLWIDVDNFKRFNDDFGHQVGDTTLKTIGEAIANSIRDRDSAFRYGGDEFVILLPGSPKEQGRTVAERIGDYLRTHPIQTGPSGELVHINLSIGVAAIQPGDTPETLLKRADELLYVAKDRGRNCIVSEI